MRRLSAAALLAGALLALACARDPVARLEREPGVLAVVGRYVVTADDLKAALAYSQAGAGDPRVQSRVWDSLVSSVLVLNDLATDPQPPTPQPLGPLGHPRAREDLVASGLQERVYSKVSVADGEVERFYREHAQEFQRGRGVLLREMLLSGVAQAKDVEGLLRRGHSFADVARLYSASPDRGAPQYFQLDELPDYLQGPIARAVPGVATAPIPVSQNACQIVLVERRCERYTLPLQEVAPEIRLKLTDEKGDALYRQYMEGLRQRFRVAVFSSKLTFAYEKETP